MRRGLFVMSPHPKDLDGAALGKDLVHQAVLDSDPAGIGAFQVAAQLLEKGRLLERVFFEYLKQRFGLGAESGMRELFGVFLGLFGVEELPACLSGRQACLTGRQAHQPGVLELFRNGVLSPLRMDSRMPGIETRYRVSIMARQSSSETRTALARLPMIWMGWCEAAVFSRSLYSVARARVTLKVVISEVLTQAYQITYAIARPFLAPADSPSREVRGVA
jgi:hypothetical protein